MSIQSWYCSKTEYSISCAKAEGRSLSPMLPHLNTQIPTIHNCKNLTLTNIKLFTRQRTVLFFFSFWKRQRPAWNNCAALISKREKGTFELIADENAPPKHFGCAYEANTHHYVTIVAVTYSSKDKYLHAILRQGSLRWFLLLQNSLFNQITLRSN